MAKKRIKIKKKFKEYKWADVLGRRYLLLLSLDRFLRSHWAAFYPRDAMLARVFAIATCLSVCPSVRPSVCPPHAGIVPSRAKAGS